MLKILLIGKGGREHALAWKLSQSKQVEHVYVVPGNPGTFSSRRISNITDTAQNDYQALVKLAKKLDIGLVVVGPDEAVVAGIEGFFRGTGIPCFSPSKEAAQLEGSKTYAKDFMQKFNIPTAAYRNFSQADEARSYLASPSTAFPIVIKASGLAAGKGVLICQTRDEAQDGIKTIMIDKAFGEEAGSSVVIEEFLEGDEISILTFSDGTTMKSLSPGQDHKRIFENDAGPNTGGMGVYAPVPMATPDIMTQIENSILKPTFAGLKSLGIDFVGLLFTGIMLTAGGPKVLEYNVRFGDPETQSVLPLLTEDTDLAEIMLACTQGRLHDVAVSIKPGFACNVIIAAVGYPENPRKGDEIEIGQLPDETLVFHAGTKLVDGKLVTDGGRVLAVVGLGNTLEGAVAKAYEGVQKISFKDMYYRKDIAHRALNRR